MGGRTEKDENLMCVHPRCGRAGAYTLKDSVELNLDGWTLCKFHAWEYARRYNAKLVDNNTGEVIELIIQKEGN